jgi:hypothetical protein
MTLLNGTKVSFNRAEMQWKIDSIAYLSDAEMDFILSMIRDNQKKIKNRTEELYQAVRKNAEQRILKADGTLKGNKKKYNPPKEDKAKKLKGKP